MCGFCVGSLFCGVVCGALLGNKGLVALLKFCCGCLCAVYFLAVARVGSAVCD